MTNSANKQQNLPGVLGEMKKLIEALSPDLRSNFKPSFDAKVTAVHDNDEDYENHYRVDLTVDQAGVDGSQLNLPKVKVDSIWAEDDYGVYALPEIGSIVTVTFDNWDITRPHVTSSRFETGKAPKGFKVGTFAIVGKHGQKFEMKHDSNEIVMSAASMKIIRNQAGQEHSGDFKHEIDNNHELIVANTDIRSAKRCRDKVIKDALREYGTLTETVDGLVKRSMSGLSETVLNNVDRQVLGDIAESVVGSKRVLIGSNYEMITVGDITIQSSPGSININSLAGEIGIGANQALPALKLKLGSAAIPELIINALDIVSGSSSTVFNQINGINVGLGSANTALISIGGDSATSPAVLGDTLADILGSLFAALMTPLQLGNFGAPTAPNPAFVAQIAPLIAKISSLLAPRILMSKT